MIETYFFWALPVLLGALLTSVITRKHKEKERFNFACDTFQSAFDDELATLKNPSLENPVDIYTLLVNAFDKHRIAVEKFRLFLKRRRRRKFCQAWRNYYAYDDTGEEATDFLLKYSPGWGNKLPSECRKLAIANIEKLLEFAKHK